MSTIVTSPHPDLDIPECTLPELLLGLGSGAQKLSAGADVSAPIFYPAPNAPRLLAKRGAPAGGDAEHGKEADDAKRNSIFNLDNLKNTLADAVGLNGKAEEKPKVPLDFDSTGPIGLVQIRSIAERVAVSLLSAFPGWKKGDVVAFYSANQHDYCAAVMGVQMAGGIAALCNPSYKPWELATQLRKIKPSLILATTETFEAAEQASHMATGKASDEEVEKLAPLVKTPALMTFDETHSASWEKELLTPPQDAWARKEELLASVKVDPKKDAAVYCFSSGTSGFPKALGLSHYNLVSNALQLHALLADQFDAPIAKRGSANGSGPSKNFHIDVLPCFHAYGLQVQLVALMTATPRTVLGRFNLSIFLTEIEKRKASFSFLVPPILLALAKHPDVANHDLSTLRRVVSGAAILSRSLANQVKDRLGVMITDGYGMSEMSPVVCCQNEKDVEEEPESIGFLTPNARARIVSPEGKDLERGEEGELLLQGPQMMLGYIDSEAANTATFTSPRSDPDCWLRTGDTAKISKAGRLTLTGRTKDMIKMSGFQVSPKELEDLLFRESYVADAAVAGVQNEDGTEIPWAFLVASKEAALLASEERNTAVLHSINAKVAGYKKIKGITWLEALPKSESGKVLKRKLERPMPQL